MQGLTERRRYYLNGTDDLGLDWRLLWQVISRVVIPSGELIVRAVAAEDLHHLKTLAHAQHYFSVDETPAILEEFLPLFQTSNLGDAFLSVYLVCSFLPTSSYRYKNQVLPSIFHLWNLLASSHVADAVFIEFLSRWVRDTDSCKETWQPMLDNEQLDYIMTHFLRLMKIPVGNSTGSSSKNLDACARNLFFSKKYQTAKDMARLLIYMLPNDAVLDHLEVFFEATETFFHPSNAGPWMSPLVSIVFELTTFAQLRINREASGEQPAKPGRSLASCTRRLVLMLRKVTFMATYARSQDIQNLAQAALQGLAFMEPQLIVPGALKRIYPSLQGLVESHRTTASLHYLASLTPILVANPVWRAHLTSLITLSLPGIDANDLMKTGITFIFLNQVVNVIPIEDLSESGDTNEALEWVQTEMARLEELIGDDDDFVHDESSMESVVKSSTAAWRDIVIMFLDRIFLLLENLPPSTSSRSGESQVQNDLAGLLPPLFKSLSGDLLKMAIDKILRFIMSHTLYNVADTMSAIVNALCKADGPLVWREFFSVLDTAIRAEVEDNGAGSTRSGGNEVLPRDRALVWYIRCLEGMVDTGGPCLFEYRKQLRYLITFLMQHCVSQATEYTGILIASFQEGLVETYTTDVRRINPEEEGMPDSGLASWGLQPSAKSLKIQWHRPTRQEVEEAADFFHAMADHLTQKVHESLDASRQANGKVGQQWTDVIVSQLSYLENLLTGATELFHSSRTRRADEEVDLEAVEYNALYPNGYVFGDRQDPVCLALAAKRNDIGKLLHETHNYLSEYHADDILCFDVLLLVIKTWFGNVGYQRADGSQSKLSSIYVEDITNFKIPGKRKQYPRAYLLRRALLYHVSRTKHSTMTINRTPLHDKLLQDLKNTSVGAYTEIRIIAQSALNLALRAVADIKALTIPFFLDALKSGEDDRVKGALYVLSGRVLKSYIGRDYRFFPEFLKRLVLLNNVEKPSMMMPVKQAFLECALKSRPPPAVCVYEKSTLQSIKPDDISSVQTLSEKRRAADAFREQEQIDLRDRLVEMTETKDWRIASAAASALGAGISASSLAPTPYLAQSIIKLSVSDHPSLRAIAMSHLSQLLAVCWLRVLTKGDLRDATLENLTIPGRIVLTSRKDGNFGKQILESLKDPAPEYFVDNERAGWLAWPEMLEAFERDSAGMPEELDPLTTELFAAMGPLMNRDWVGKIIEFWKEEPKEGNGKFRATLQHIVRLFFVCSRRMPGAVTLDELKPEIEALCAKGALHYHSRVGAELLSGLIGSLRYETGAVHDEVWAWAGNIIKEVLTSRLTPDNLAYWQQACSIIFMHRDPRRFFPLLEIISNLPLDMESYSAFAESAKISVLRKTVAAVGWHYQSGDKAIEKFIAHVDHPYKRVRDEIGRALNNLFAMQYFESHPSVAAFLQSNQEAKSSLGVVPYQPNAKLTHAMQDLFKKLHVWRLERPEGQEAPSQYTMGSKTIATWVYNSIDMTEAYLLLPFVPDLILPEILHMMDVKEDHDLLVIAVGVFKHLGNIVYPISQVKPMVDALVRIMTSDPSWHHRLRVMAVVQVFFYRNMFSLSRDDRGRLFDSVVELLSDSQLEVREGAAGTISGMVRASSYDREKTIQRLIERFTQVLDDSPLPKRRRLSQRPSEVSLRESSDLAAIIVRRHSACLGLAALVTAFPYGTPPPWLPAVLARLARCSDNPHPIGISIKRVLASFKKTHNDTWHSDEKVFTQQELEDLAEPSHTYFA
jgi:proteasome activator subunit 4